MGGQCHPPPCELGHEMLGEENRTFCDLCNVHQNSERSGKPWHSVCFSSCNIKATVPVLPTVSLEIKADMHKFIQVYDPVLLLLESSSMVGKE